MIIFTKEITTKLVDNFKTNSTRQEDGKDEIDQIPVVKVFNPYGVGTWLLTELNPENNMLFGLCDLGMGFPELGAVSKEELENARVMGNLHLERDKYFEPEKTLSQFADEASRMGRTAKTVKKLTSLKTDTWNW